MNADDGDSVASFVANTYEDIVYNNFDVNFDRESFEGRKSSSWWEFLDEFIA